MFPQQFLNPTFFTLTKNLTRFFSPTKCFCLTVFTQKKDSTFYGKKCFEIQLGRHSDSSKYEIISLNWKPITTWKVSVFSRIWTAYWEIRSISRYSVRMWENTDQKNSDNGHFSGSVFTKPLMDFQEPDTFHRTSCSFSDSSGFKSIKN